MSVKIKVSYEHPEEYRVVRELLAPIVGREKPVPPKGRYQRVYILTKSMVKKPSNPGPSTDSD